MSDQNKNTKIMFVKYWKKVASCESVTKLFSSQWLHQRNLSKDYRSVTLDVTAAMLVLYQKNPAGNELLSMKKISFVLRNLHGCWPRDWKKPIKRYHRKLLLRFRPQTQKLSFIELSYHSILEAKKGHKKKKRTGPLLMKNLINYIKVERNYSSTVVFFSQIVEAITRHLLQNNLPSLFTDKRDRADQGDPGHEQYFQTYSARGSRSVFKCRNTWPKQTGIS